MNIIIHTLLMIPIGFAVSVLTERVASLEVLTRRFPQAWNTLIKILVTFLSWNYIIHNNTSSCFRLNRNIHPNFDPTQDPWCLIAVILLRAVVFSAASKLGSALQPVGLTGGIACGKTTVAQMLRQSSQYHKRDAFVVIDLDTIAHDILIPGKLGSDSAYQRVIDAFQEHDILEDSSTDDNHGNKHENAHIDRRKLGSIIFQEPSKRKVLNKITHPLISKIMMKRIINEGIFPTSSQTSVVAVDIPLLFEIGMQMRILFGLTVVVACHPDLQLKRLMNRNQDLTKEQCKDRIKSQIPIEKKVCMADIVILNNGTVEDLEHKVEDARQQILARTRAFGNITLSKAVLMQCVWKIFQCIFECIS